MRILQVASGYHPEIGGVERHVQGLSENLVRLGCSVVVATMAPCSMQPRSESINGVTVRRFAYIGPRAYGIPIGLWAYLKRDGSTFDLCHAHNLHSLPLAMSIVARLPHLVITPNYHGQGHSCVSRWLHRIYDPLVVPSLDYVHRVVCLSPAEAELVFAKLKIPRPRVVVIPSGIEAPTKLVASADPARRPSTVLSVGRLEAYKRVDRVIQALAYLPEHRLIIIGQGPERCHLENLATRLGVEHRVDFLGAVAEETKQSWYQRTGVVVSLSEAESFSLVVLEAISTGCPVVCSDIPTFRHFQQEFPKTVTLAPQDIEPWQLAELIQQTQSQAMCPLLNTARYHWEKVARDTLNVYATTVSGGHSLTS